MSYADIDSDPSDPTNRFGGRANKELTLLTMDSDRWLPSVDLIGTRLVHLGNGKTYQITGFTWLGESDLWGYLHHELRDDGLQGLTVARPLSHISGDRSNGERRYHILDQ